jgi:uncharacterized MAPEG superfamily protein
VSVWGEYADRHHLWSKELAALAFAPAGPAYVICYVLSSMIHVSRSLLFALTFVGWYVFFSLILAGFRGPSK